jgi:hypothetical protein
MENETALSPGVQGSCRDYFAIIILDGKAVWRCVDHHETPEEAQACAKKHVSLAYMAHPKES